MEAAGAFAAILAIVITGLATPGQELLNSAWASQPIVQVSTDRINYNLGEPVTVSGQIFPTAQNQSVVVQIFNPKGNLINIEPIYTKGDGQYRVVFKIGGPYAIEGVYKAVATYGPSQATVQFDMQAAAFETRNIHDLAIQQGAQFEVHPKQVVVLTGTSTINGTLIIDKGGKVINHSSLTGVGGSIINYGAIRNYNTMTMRGCSVSLESYSVFINSGKLVVISDSCNGALTNNGILNNQGTLLVMWQAGDSHQGTIVNNRTINNFQSATFHVWGTFLNNGLVKNSGQLRGLLTPNGDKPNQASSIVNSGSIKNYCGSAFEPRGTFSGNEASNQCV